MKSRVDGSGYILQIAGRWSVHFRPHTRRVEPLDMWKYRATTERVTVGSDRLMTGDLVGIALSTRRLCRPYSEDLHRHCVAGRAVDVEVHVAGVAG